MVRNGAVHPRWVLRRDERRAGRYEGDKVVRWIARPTLMKGRAKESANAEAGDSGDCQEFRVRAAIVDPMEVLDGTTQSTPYP